MLGVLPWLDVDLEDEDGVALQVGKYDGKTEEVLDIVVVQLPHIANFTDFNALAAQPDVRLRYESDPLLVGEPDLLIILGSKNTLGDLLWLRQKGMDKAILTRHAQGTPVAGICGGYQILGKHIYDDVESGLSDLPGLGLLDITTRFSPEKIPPRPPEPCAAHCRGSGQPVRVNRSAATRSTWAYPKPARMPSRLHRCMRKTASRATMLTVRSARTAV